MATMEAASAAGENLYYLNLDATRTTVPGNYLVDNAYSNPNEKAFAGKRIREQDWGFAHTKSNGGR